MNSKLSIGLLTTLGVSVLLASALAQQQGNDDPRSQPGRLTRTIPVEPSLSSGSSSLGVITETPARLQNVEPTISLYTQTQGDQNWATTFAVPGFSTPVRGNAEGQLAHRADELAKKFGEAKSEADRSQIKTELRELLEKQFGLRQKRHQDEIAGLEAKVKKLKELLEKRQENRREIISKRIDQILSTAEGLGW